MIYLIFTGTIGLIAWILYVILSPVWQSDRTDLTRWLGLIRSRNFFLLGFIYFQLYGSAYFALVPWDYVNYLLIGRERGHFLFLLYATLFLVSFFTAYRLTGRKFTVPQSLAFESDPSLPLLWIPAIVIALLSLSLRFALVVPIVGPALNHWLSMGSAVACGLAAFAWGRNIGNPVSIVVLGFTLAMGLVNVILTDFGRRNLLAQAIAVLVCTWVAGCMHRRLKQTTIAVAIMAVAGIVLLTAFTSARNDRNAPRSDRLGFLFSDFAVEEVLKLGVPGDTAPASLWLIDSHPQSRGFKTETLYSIRYFFWHYAPRGIFPDKPEPLSVRIPEMARMRNVAVGTLTIGPGLMGHVAHDGGWWVAPIYGVILGVFFGLVDTFLMKNIYRPFAVVAVVCAYGQLFGLARGESPVFLGIACIALLGWIPIMRGWDALTGQTRS